MQMPMAMMKRHTDNDEFLMTMKRITRDDDEEKVKENGKT